MQFTPSPFDMQNVDKIKQNKIKHQCILGPNMNGWFCQVSIKEYFLLEGDHHGALQCL